MVRIQDTRHHVVDVAETGAAPGRVWAKADHVLLDPNMMHLHAT